MGGIGPRNEMDVNNIAGRQCSLVDFAADIDVHQSTGDVLSRKRVL